MLTRSQKEEQVADLRDRFGRATSVFVADYRGVSVQDIDELRSKMHEGESGDYEYRVAKNSILRRAVSGSDLEPLGESFIGPTAIAISYGDPVSLAKTLVNYAKDHEVFELKGGFLDGKTLDTGEIATLATLPNLEQLRGQLAGLLLAPATKLARLLVEPGTQLARLVEARRASQAGSEG